MKKLFLFSVIFPILLGSCSRDPLADFFASSNVVTLDETVHFTNNSMDADRFEWDFGDGTYSNAANASHSYSEPGMYTVRLLAFSGKHNADKAYTVIQVLFPTSLEITVLEYYDEYPVDNASVILYGNLDDWIDQKNPSPEGITDPFGRVIFTNLEMQRYYVDAWEEYHNNYQLAEEDVGFIETGMMMYPNEMNYFLAYVDYVEPTQKSTGGREEGRRILKMERMDGRSYQDKMENIRLKVEERKAEVEKNGISMENVVRF